MAEQSTNTKTEGGATSGAATGVSTGASSVSSDTNTSSATGAAEDLRQRVASTVASAADTQKNRAADGLGNIADVARQTGEELRGQNEMLASWVNAASDQLRTIADRLRDRPAAELADDLASFARQRPALFIGGAFLLGLGVARLLKASPDRAYATRGYGYPGMREYRETGMGGTLSGTGEGRSSGAWARDTGAY
jgi:hypothetical protein